MKKKIMAFVFVLLALFTLGACTKTTTTTTRKTRPSRSTTTRYVWTTKTTTTKTYTFLPVDLTGETVGFKKRLEDTGNRHGFDSEPYKKCKETILWLENRKAIEFLTK